MKGSKLLHLSETQTLSILLGLPSLPEVLEPLLDFIPR